MESQVLSSETVELLLDLVNQVTFSGQLTPDQIEESARRVATAKRELLSLREGVTADG